MRKVEAGSTCCATGALCTGAPQTPRARARLTARVRVCMLGAGRCGKEECVWPSTCCTGRMGRVCCMGRWGLGRQLPFSLTCALHLYSSTTQCARLSSHHTWLGLASSIIASLRTCNIFGTSWPPHIRTPIHSPNKITGRLSRCLVDAQLNSSSDNITRDLSFDS